VLLNYGRGNSNPQGPQQCADNTINDVTLSTEKCEHGLWVEADN